MLRGVTGVAKLTDGERQIVDAVITSIEKPKAGAIYNVCDDEPAPPHEVVES